MMIIDYIKTRFSVVKFILLSFLLCLMVYDIDTNWSSWASGVAFLFFSLFTFRMLDDAGSVHYDRTKYPKRTYLNEENYPSFLKYTFSIVSVYLFSLFFYNQAYLVAIFMLLGISVFAYFFFGKNKVILPIIPLFKYPVLLWCLMGFSNEVNEILVALSSLFIIASHDIIELIDKKTWALNVSLFILIFIGFLIFPFWTNNLYLILLLPLIIFFIRKWKYSAYLPILFYPISYFILTNFI